MDDLTEVIRTCDVIEIEDCTPHYLRAFIVGRLKVGFPLKRPTRSLQPRADARAVRPYQGDAQHPLLR